MTGSLSQTRGRPEPGIAQLPGFVASLRLLVEEERYSLTDIALMFDVSRERIRQLCSRYDVKSPDGYLGLLAVRIWDDASNRFRPVSRGEITRQALRSRMAARRAEREGRRTDRAQAVVRTVIELTQQLRREPSWREMYVAITGDVGTIPLSSYAVRVLSMFDSRSVGTPQKLRAFRRRTGTTGRPSGTPGHLHRGRSPVCGICGTAWRVAPSGYRWCPERKRHPLHLAALSPAYFARRRHGFQYATSDYEHAMTQAGAFNGVADLFEKIAEAENAAAVSPEAPHGGTP